MGDSVAAPRTVYLISDRRRGSPAPVSLGRGWSEAFGPTPQLIPVEMVAHAKGTDGRGERGRASLAHLRFRPRFVLENVTQGARSWPAAYRKAG